MLSTPICRNHRQSFDQLLHDSTHIAPLLEAKGYRPCGII
jgi:hypothetical protein